jgi:hypothetical protein
VRVLKVGGELDLLEEAPGAEHRGELRVEHLHRHEAAVADVAGEIDGGHAAPAELALGDVAVGQSRPERGGGFGQRIVRVDSAVDASRNDAYLLAHSGRATRIPVARRIAATYSGSVARVTSTTPPDRGACRTRRTPPASR